MLVFGRIAMYVRKQQPTVGYLDAVVWTRETLCGVGLRACAAVHAGSGALSRLKMDGWALVSLGAECGDVLAAAKSST